MQADDPRAKATFRHLLVPALAALALAGCGGGSDDESSSDPIKVKDRQEMIKEGGELCSKALEGQGPVTPIDLSNDQLKRLADRTEEAAQQLGRITGPSDVLARLDPTRTSLIRVANASRKIIPVNRDEKPGTTRALQEELIRDLAQLRISTKISRLPTCEVRFART